MGRLLALALVLAVAAGAATLALGGVRPRAEKAAEPSDRESGARATPPRSRRQTSADTARRRPIAATVSMRDLAFVSTRVTVRPGRAVRWLNRDDVDHLIYAEQRAGNGAPDFASARIAPGESFIAAPSGPGIYRYVCTLHPTVMQGVVRVTD